MRKKVLIPLLTVLLLFFGSIYFFSDNIIEKGLISSLQKVAKAKVEISDTRVTFSPFGVEIKGLRIADSANPMQNSVDIEQLTAKVYFAPLLKKKIIIEKIKIDSLSTNTPRKRSGALSIKTKKSVASSTPAPSQKSSSKSKSTSTKSETKEKDKKKKSSLDLTSLTKKTDVTHLLDKRDLKLTAATSTLEKTIQDKQSYWENKFNTTDYKEKLSELNKEVKRFESVSVSDLNDFKTLPDTLSTISDVLNGYKTLANEIAEQKKAFDRDLAEINSGYTALSQTIDQDFNEIVAELDVNHFETSRIGSALFGESLTDKIYFYIDKLVSIRNQLPRVSSHKPTSQERERGQDIHFKLAKKELPFLWIKSIIFSGEGKINTQGYISDITSHQDRIGKLTKFQIKLTQNNNTKQSSDINGFANFFQGNSIISLVYKSKNSTVEKRRLLGGTQPIHLDKATLNTEIKLTINKNQLRGKSDLLLRDITLKENYAGQSLSAASLISQSIQSLSPLIVNITLSGNITAPKLAIHSNLDKAVKNELYNLTQEKINETKRALKAALNQQLLAQQKETMALINSFSNYNNNLQEVSQNINTEQETIKRKEAELKEQEKAITKKAAAPLKKEQKKIEKALKNQFKSLF